MNDPLVRADLDKMQIEAGGQVGLGCSNHPASPLQVLYKDGQVRILCRACGFETTRVKVSDG